jgi:ATP-binding cassette, subfamily A (ABC1), member 3
VKPTSGSIEINGIDISANFSMVRKFIGYCPQTNPIFDEMSVIEHLRYYSVIKGIPGP